MLNLRDDSLKVEQKEDALVIKPSLKRPVAVYVIFALYIIGAAFMIYLFIRAPEGTQRTMLLVKYGFIIAIISFFLIVSFLRQLGGGQRVEVTREGVAAITGYFIFTSRKYYPRAEIEGVSATPLKETESFLLQLKLNNGKPSLTLVNGWNRFDLQAIASEVRKILGLKEVEDEALAFSPEEQETFFKLSMGGEAFLRGRQGGKVSIGRSPDALSMNFRSKVNLIYSSFCVIFGSMIGAISLIFAGDIKKMLLSGGSYSLLDYGIPLIAGLFFLGAGLILLFLALWISLGREFILVSEDGVLMFRYLLWIRMRSFIEGGQVTGLEVVPEREGGPSLGGGPIRVLSQSGKKICFGAIIDSEQALPLAREAAALLGLSKDKLHGLLA